MSTEELNINYIREKTGLVENDELIPIILEMIKESYKSGLCQSEFDNTMCLIEQNQELKKQLENCYCNRTDCSGRIKDSKTYDSLVQKVENQQKEFIEYLENYIEDRDKARKLHETYSESENRLSSQYFILQEILSKFKEIIGVSNEK